MIDYFQQNSLLCENEMWAYHKLLSAQGTVLGIKYLNSASIIDVNTGVENIIRVANYCNYYEAVYCGRDSTIYVPSRNVSDCRQSGNHTIGMMVTFLLEQFSVARKPGPPLRPKSFPPFHFSESTGLSPDVVGDDIEEFADAFCEHGYANKSAQNYVCLIYVASTNEFTYREYLKDDSGVEIDWMKVERAFCNDDTLATKYRNVCSIITTGEEISRGDFKGANVLLIAIISGEIVIAAGIIVCIFVRRKKTS